MKTRRMGLSGLAGMAGAAVVLLTLGQASEAHAQTVESRWLAWIGCWEGAGIAEGETESPLLVCFRPTEGGAAVESLTYAEGTLLGSEILRADGSPSPMSEGGCEGSRTMRWSEDGRRVFLDSQMNCGEGVTRSTRGVFTHLPDRMGWTNILALQMGESSPLLEIRSFVPASPALLIQVGVADPMAGIELAVNTARLNAGAPLSANAVAELVTHAGAAAAGGVLVERGDRLNPDAEMLRALSRSGVPGEVLDIVVALSHPDRFQFAGGTPNALAQETAGDRGDFAFTPAVAPWGASQRVYSRWGQAYYVGRNHLIADPYGAAFYGVDYYGYPMYAYPYSMYPSMGFPYGAYPFRSNARFPRYYLTQPPVVVTPGPSVPSEPPARVDRNGGFSGGNSGSSATPRSTGSTATPRSAPATTSAPAAAPASSEGGSSAPEPRRAVPRP